MPDFVTLCHETEIPPGKAKVFQVHGAEIALFNLGGTIYATQQECLHRQGPLSEGEIQGTTVTCPWHGWQYDLTTGEHLPRRKAKLKTYVVKVEGGEVKVAI